MLIEMLHLFRLRSNIPHKYPSVVKDEWRQIFRINMHEENADGNRLVTRKELAVMINNLAEPPFSRYVRINGTFRK